MSPQSQADAHKYGNPRAGQAGEDDYIFGLRSAWVLAPERDGAHNYEGQGHLCAVHAVEVLAALTAGTAYAANASAVIYAGHSRGGHGAW